MFGLKFTPLELIGALGTVFFGLGYFISKFRSGSEEDLKKKDAAEIRLIDTLQKQIDASDRDIKSLQKMREDDLLAVSGLKNSLEKIQTERNTYKLILENRDKDSIEFKTIMVNAASLAQNANTKAEENNKMLRVLVDQGKKTSESIDRIASLFELHLKKIEHIK